MLHNKSDPLLHPEISGHLNDPEASASWEGPTAAALGAACISTQLMTGRILKGCPICTVAPDNPPDSHRVFDMVKGVSGKQNVGKAEVLIMTVFGQICGPSLIICVVLNKLLNLIELALL